MTPPPEPRMADDTRSPLGRALAHLVLDAWNGLADEERLLARLDTILSEAEAAGAPLREALERGCYFCGASGIAPHAGCPGGNVPQDMGLADALAIVFADLDGTPGPVFGSYWQDRADAVLAAWHAALTARQSEATTPAPAPLDVIPVAVLDKAIRAHLEEWGQHQCGYDPCGKNIAKHAARLALAATPAPAPLDVTPEILAHALDDVLREEAYDASKDGPSTGFTIPTMDEDEYTRDLFMERGTALYARLTALAAATEDTDDATK